MFYLFISFFVLGIKTTGNPHGLQTRTSSLNSTGVSWLQGSPSSFCSRCNFSVLLSFCFFLFLNPVCICSDAYKRNTCLCVCTCVCVFFGQSFQTEWITLCSHYGQENNQMLHVSQMSLDKLLKFHSLFLLRNNHDQNSGTIQLLLNFWFNSFFVM